MSNSYDDFRQTAEVNNSFSISSVNKILNDVTRNSFQYLHQLQANTVLFEQFHSYYNEDGSSITTPYIRDYYRNNRFELCVDLNYNLFGSANIARYRTSKYYKTRLKYLDIMNEHTVFNRIPLLIINNRVYIDMMVEIYENRVTFILKDIPELYIKDQLNKLQSHDIIILLINHPNYQATEYLTYNRWVTTTDIGIIPNNINIVLDEDIQTIAWFEYKTSDTSRLKCLAPSFISKRDDGRFHIMNITSEMKLILKNSYQLKLHTIQIPRLYRYEFTTSDGLSSSALNYYEDGSIVTKCEPIVLLKDDTFITLDHPVPVSSFIILKKSIDSEEYKLINAQESLQLHYPNIYEIIDRNMKNGDRYMCYYHYCNPDKNSDNPYTPKDNLDWIRYCDNKFTNRHLFFYRYLYNKTNTPQKVIVKELYLNPDSFIKRYVTIDQFYIERFLSIWNIIFSYKWYVHNVDITDYSHYYQFNTLKNIEEKSLEPFEYKVSKMWEFISDDDSVLHEYVKYQNIVGESHFLFANTTHMDSRIRIDTTHEMEDNLYVFTETMYVFEFMEYTTTHPFEIRVFVDGLYADRAAIIKNNESYFVYVPVSMFEWDSYCEVELFPSFSYNKSFSLYDLDDEITVDLNGLFNDKKIQPTIADLFVTLGDNDKVTFSDNFFRIISQVGDKEYEYTDEEGSRYMDYSPMRKFKLSLTDALAFDYTNDFTLHFEKNPYTITYFVEEDGYPIISLDGFNFKPRADYIRIFKNGRLMTPGCFTVTYRTSPCILQFFVECKKDDLVTIDITPYRYHEIFYKEELTSGESLIDVSSYITKPFCNRYYDVYVNGRKMSWNSVFAITPTQLSLVNLHSKKNIQIFEIERDSEYFGLDYTVVKREYDLDDFIKEGFITPDDLKQIINDRIQDDKHPDLVIRDRDMDEEDEPRYNPDDWYNNLLEYYYNELTPKIFINPDKLQSDYDYVKDHYPVIEHYFFIKKNRILLDPDIVIKNDTNDQFVLTYGANEELL